MNISRCVLESLFCAFSAKDLETGGMLGEADGNIVAFYHDQTGKRDVHSYIPDTHILNHILKVWDTQNISFAGLVHTHTKNSRLSDSDLCYGKRISASFHKDIILGIFVLEMQELFLYQIHSDGQETAVSHLTYRIMDPHDGGG